MTCSHLPSITIFLEVIFICVFFVNSLPVHKYLLNVDICRVLYLICLKTEALCPKKVKKKQNKKKNKEKHFFFHLLLNDIKRPRECCKCIYRLLARIGQGLGEGPIHLFLEPCDDMSHSLALGRPVGSDRTCPFTGQELCLFVVLTKTTQKCTKKK